MKLSHTIATIAVALAVFSALVYASTNDTTNTTTAINEENNTINSNTGAQDNNLDNSTNEPKSLSNSSSGLANRIKQAKLKIGQKANETSRISDELNKPQETAEKPGEQKNLQTLPDAKSTTDATAGKKVWKYSPENSTINITAKIGTGFLSGSGAKLKSMVSGLLAKLSEPTTRAHLTGIAIMIGIVIIGLAIYFLANKIISE